VRAIDVFARDLPPGQEVTLVLALRGFGRDTHTLRTLLRLDEETSFLHSLVDGIEGARQEVLARGVPVEPSLEPSPAPGPSNTVRVDHAWIDVVDPRTGDLVVGDVDAAASAVDRVRISVVRFQVVKRPETPLQPHTGIAPGWPTPVLPATPPTTTIKNDVLGWIESL